jgi:hypothetical protein
LFRQYGLTEGPWREWVMSALSGEITLGGILFTFFANLLMWSLFAMVGGILTVAILNKKRAQTQQGF